METKERSLEIARTIASQIGGRAFVMMGAKNKMALENGLAFKIGHNAGKVTHIRVKLNAMDLYDVEYIRIHGAKMTTLSESNGLYADMLLVDFAEKTGMSMSL